METLRYFYIVLFLISFTSCKLTEKSVLGKWVSNYSDTLSLNNDHSFSLIQKTGMKKDGTPLYDSSVVFYSGNWAISNKYLKMDFKQGSGKEIFGDCDGLEKRSKWFSNYSLQRSKTCKSPTFDFVTFSKAR
jgi:hypothetical protein